MATLLSKIEFQGQSFLFHWGETQRKFGWPKVNEFQTKGVAKYKLFTTSVCGVSIHLVAEDVAHILAISLGGWDQYVMF